MGAGEGKQLGSTLQVPSPSASGARGGCKQQPLLWSSHCPVGPVEGRCQFPSAGHPCNQRTGTTHALCPNLRVPSTESLGSRAQAPCFSLLEAPPALGLGCLHTARPCFHATHGALAAAQGVPSSQHGLPLSPLLLP